MRIFLSPSNQTHNIYKDGKSTECDVCYLIAQKTQNYLSKEHEVKLGMKNATLAQRCFDSDTFGADYHICIHTNAGGGEGTEVYCHPKNTSNQYVKAVYNNVANLTPTKDRGIKASSTLFEINHPKAITIYIECEFHDTHGDWIIENVDKIACAIAQAFVKEIDEAPIMEHTPLYKVQCGAFIDKDRATTYAKHLNSLGIETYIVKE